MGKGGGERMSLNATPPNDAMRNLIRFACKCAVLIGIGSIRTYFTADDKYFLKRRKIFSFGKWQ